MTFWFGESWGAPCCEPELRVPVPIGEPCARCGEQIAPGDQGMTMWATRVEGEVGYASLIHYHLDCTEWLAIEVIS